MWLGDSDLLWFNKQTRTSYTLTLLFSDEARKFTSTSRFTLTSAITSLIIFSLSFLQTSQQKDGRVISRCSVRGSTNIELRDMPCRTAAGNATNRQFVLQVYLHAFDLRLCVPLGPYTFTKTRTEEGFSAGYNADRMLKLFFAGAKALYMSP